MEKLPYGSFENCIELEQIELPRNLMEIDSYAFRKCGKLKGIDFPDGLREIGYDAFLGCVSLQRVILPVALRKIGSSAFFGCTAMTSLQLPDGLKELRRSAFGGCAKLTHITIPSGITKLEQGVFSGCSELRQVVIPDSVAEISRYAFTGCVNLKVVECNAIERFASALLDTPYWKKNHLDDPMPVRLALDMVGNRSGKYLRERGYTLFDADREYYISLPGEDGIVEVKSWCSEDGPDEDGFGREEYYDWWLLDEELKMLPGIPMWHEYSNMDMRNHEKEWNALREKAAEIVRRCKK